MTNTAKLNALTAGSKVVKPNMIITFKCAIIGVF